MKKYEILPHPAELRIRVYGKTIEELFMNAAEALTNIQKKNITLALRSQMQCNKKLKKEIIEIGSLDLNSLLVDFLSEILAKSQIDKKVYKVVKLKVYKEKSQLEGEIIGAPVDRFDEDIKAVTYQGVDIKLKPKTLNLKPKTWQTDLVFDV